VVFGLADSESELRFATGNRNQTVSAHAQWKNGNNRLKITFFGLKLDLYGIFGHAESESELLFATVSRNQCVSARAQWKNGKIGLKSRFSG